MAMRRWLRVVANRGTGAYDVYEATGKSLSPNGLTSASKSD
jgi:hypothetical protein